jgi:hypothetical protein
VYEVSRSVNNPRSFGETIFGEVERYGMINVVSVGSGRETRAYVDDYWLSLEQVKRKISEKCQR